MNSSGDRSALPWPKVSWEDQHWLPPADAVLRRRERFAADTTYRSAVAPAIAVQGMDLPARLAADVDEATAAVAAFDARTGGRSGALLGVLMRSESASSSQIEQITASARAIAEAEVTGLGSGNAAVVARNVAAMNEAMHLDGPISADGIEQVQRTLMSAGDDKLTGWRDSPVWIGGRGSSPLTADFVPPHHKRIRSSIDDLVQFIQRDDLPVLVQAAIAHAHFETIHPFADGNGRTGRALVHMILREKGLVASATVPLSAGLLARKDRYFDALTAYRGGDAAPIVDEFAHAALHAAHSGQQLADRIVELQQQWRSSIRARSDSAVWRVIDVLPAHPVLDAEAIATAVGSDSRNIHRQLRSLADAGILTGGQHDKSRRYLYRAQEILDAMDECAQDFGRRQRL